VVSFFHDVSERVPRFFFLLATILVVGIGCSRQTTENEKETKVVQADVRRMLSALFTNNIDTVLAHTHPKIIASLGGVTAAKAALQPGLAQIQSSQMSLVSLTFPQAPSFIATAERKYVVVPTLSTIAAKGQRTESFNFQFGIKEKTGTNWTYIEGSRINPQILGAFFPDFPSDYKFPQFYRKKL
jgi:hypothetical protein